jgi:protein-disulfide isomerase
MTNEQRTQLWIAGIFLVLIIGITIIATLASGNAVTPANGANFTPTQTAALSATDHTRGAANTTVSLMEYGDFQCPACGAYEPLVEQLYKTYGDKVQFVFRNFPLYQVHQDAGIGAQAAEAAALQGKYWEMHDLLYKTQATWSTAAAADVVSKYFDGYAQSLGMNVSTFDTDINSTAVKAKVDADATLGNTAQVNHTPTFFINLTQIANPQSYADFAKVIDAALASSTTK